MTRILTPLTSPETEKLLGVLTNEQSGPSEYQAAMTALGRSLADGMLRQVPALRTLPVCVACTVEDADYLAKGILDGLEGGGVDPARLKLVCFWNERVRSFNGSAAKLFDVAPIVKSYREEVDLQQSIIVVVKSIISGACVVKTNLTALIDRVVPERVLVAAPVMLLGAEKRLASEFPEQTAKRFEYFTFAVDDKKSDDGEMVLPGIGGSVYERLGFTYKNTYVPNIVRQRRSRPARMSRA